MKFIGLNVYLRKGQRNALLVLVVLLLNFSLFKDFATDPKPLQWDEQLMLQHQKWIDSIAKSCIQISRDQKLRHYPFNPNYLSDHRAYVLGMETHSIDRLIAFRKSGKWIYSAKEFKSVTGIDDSLMAVIEPYLIFPEPKKQPIEKMKML